MESPVISPETRWHDAWRHLFDPERLLRERPSLTDVPLPGLARLWRQLVGADTAANVVTRAPERYRLTIEQALHELHAAILHLLTASDETSGLIRSEDFAGRRFHLQPPDEIAAPASLLGVSLAGLPADHWLRQGQQDDYWQHQGEPALILGPGLPNAPGAPRAFYCFEHVRSWTRQLATHQREQARLLRERERREAEQERIARERDPRHMFNKLQGENADLREQLAELRQLVQAGKAS